MARGLHAFLDEFMDSIYDLGGRIADDFRSRPTIEQDTLASGRGAPASSGMRGQRGSSADSVGRAQADQGAALGELSYQP